MPLTAEQRVLAHEMAEKTALDQGLPAKVEDPATLARVAILLRSPSARLPAAGGGRPSTPFSPEGAPPRGRPLTSQQDAQGLAPLP